MNILRHLLIKEFKQIFRDPAILRLIFIVPAIQLLVLPFTADYEIKHIRIGIVDHDHSAYARALVRKLAHSTYFDLASYSSHHADGPAWIEDDLVDLFVEIPAHFEVDLVRDQQAGIQLVVNAVNGTKGSLGATYASRIIREFNEDVRAEWIRWPRVNPVPVIEVTHRAWYNRDADYQTFMVPGILAVLLTMVGVFLAALNIVREKEIGTIEQLNVTPIRKVHFILGKLIPFWLLSFVILTIGLLISYVVHGIVPQSNIGLLYLFSGVYVFAVLGLGLLISNFTNTQQQAMMIAFFFMLIFIL
ncbi:MAG: ABC transporter permease, partial [Saprospiraceae bacterium]|nr:ABC transporter permease [Saprospiraceae bacterium]